MSIRSVSAAAVFSVLALSAPVLSDVAHADAMRDVTPPAAPQAVVDRLVREPLRYDGTATGVAALDSTIWRNGRVPTRVLIGLHPVDASSVVPGSAARPLAGEIVALDVENRPVAAAPIAGTISAAPGPRATTAACELRTHLAADLVLRGVCGPELLSGTMHTEEPALARLAIDIGLASPSMTAGQYWLGPLR